MERGPTGMGEGGGSDAPIEWAPYLVRRWSGTGWYRYAICFAGTFNLCVGPKQNKIVKARAPKNAGPAAFVLLRLLRC